MQDWFLRTSEYKNLSDNISREIYNKINAELGGVEASLSLGLRF